MLVLGLAGILALVMYLSIQTNEPIGTVIMAFAPAIITVLLVYLAFLNIDNRKTIYMLPIISVLFSIGLFVGLMQTSSAIQNLSEPQTVMVLNGVLTFIPCGLICLLSRRGPKKVTVEEIIEEADETMHDDTKPHEQHKHRSTKMHPPPTAESEESSEIQPIHEKTTMHPPPTEHVEETEEQKEDKQEKPKNRQKRKPKLKIKDF